MKIQPSEIADVLLIEPKVFGDGRGFFYESFNAKAFAEATGVTKPFVQDNHSLSQRSVLRGLHYQITQPQGKLVRVISGEVYDVAVDLRRGSATFGRWTGFILSAENRLMAWIPPGFAHGFLVLSSHAEFLYKTTDYYAPASERTLLWNDASVAVDWPLDGRVPILAAKDIAGTPMADAETYEYGASELTC